MDTARAANGVSGFCTATGCDCTSTQPFLKNYYGEGKDGVCIIIKQHCDKNNITGGCFDNAQKQVGGIATLPSSGCGTYQIDMGVAPSNTSGYATDTLGWTGKNMSVSCTGSPDGGSPGTKTCTSGWCTSQAECSANNGMWGGANDGYCSPNTLGQCCVGSTGGGTSNPPPTAAPRTCGQSCNSTSDCLNPSGGGFPVECRNNKCQLPLTGPYACPEGMSSGSICGCSAKQQCGQPCGPAVGNKLCAPGSVCGFITPSNACMVNGVQQTAKQYCLPVNPGSGYSLKRCDVEPAANYIAADSLVKPGGSQANLTVTDVQNACKSVCGDKVIGTGEECDAGTDNGKAGSMCDATCKVRKVCGDACSYQSMCNRHLVTLTCIPDAGSGRSYCGLDAIIDGTTNVEQTDARIIKPGMWRTQTSTSFSGGSEIYNHERGATISFMTASRDLTLVQTFAPNRGKLLVSIDGKQQTGIDQYSATTKYKQRTIINMRTADTPEYVCQSGACRLASNPTSPTCGPVTSSPTPTPVPPTPSPLVCDLNVSWTSNGNPDAWKFGDMVTFTVAPAPSSRIPTGGSIRYEGQVAAYRGTSNVQSITLTPISTGASKFQPMKVERANSTYYFRFRYCVKSASGQEACTNWGSWQVPS